MDAATAVNKLLHEHVLPHGVKVEHPHVFPMLGRRLQQIEQSGHKSVDPASQILEVLLL